MKHNKFLIIAILVFITAGGLSFYIKNPVLNYSSPKKLAEETKDFIVETKDTIFKKENPEKQIKLLFIGDIMMDRHIRSRAEKLGYDFYFSCATQTFKKYDFVVANLESTVTNYPSVSFGKPQTDINHFRFTIDPVALAALKNAGINVLGVDNNHIYDFDKEGVALTRENILESGLNYFGDPIDENYFNLRLEKDGIVFNLISFNEFFGSADKTLKNIEKVKSVGSLSIDNIIKDEPIIIFSHWGR
jgi:hypothetical protein